MKTMVFLCVSSLVMLSGCNTFYGIGQDMKSAGEGVADTAQKAKDKINEQ